MGAEREIRATHEEVVGFVQKLRDIHASLGDSEIRTMLEGVLGTTRGEVGGYGMYKRSGSPRGAGTISCRMARGPGRGVHGRLPVDALGSALDGGAGAQAVVWFWFSKPGFSILPLRRLLTYERVTKPLVASWRSCPSHLLPSGRR